MGVLYSRILNFLIVIKSLLKVTILTVCKSYSHKTLTYQRKNGNQHHFILKMFLYLSLSGVSITPASAHLGRMGIHAGLYSQDPEERMVALQNITQTSDTILHRKLIEMALFDESLEVRTTAEYILNNIQPIDSNEQRWRTELSSASPDAQLKAIHALKKIKNMHPIVQYTLLKEVVFRYYAYYQYGNPSENQEYLDKHQNTITQEQSKLMNTQKVIEEILLIVTNFYKHIEKMDILRDITFYPHIQWYLLQIAISEKVSDTVSTKAKNILTMMKSIDLEIQKELLYMATADTTPDTIRTIAQGILTETKSIHLEIQKVLLGIVISNIASDTSIVSARDILKRSTSISSKIEKQLVYIATSDESSLITRMQATDILLGSPSNPEFQLELVHIATSNKTSTHGRTTAEFILYDNPSLHPIVQQELANIVTSDTISKLARTTAENILNTIKSIDPEVEINLIHKAVSGSASDVTKTVTKNILLTYTSYMHLLSEKAQKELLNIVISNIFTKPAKAIAWDILNKTSSLYFPIQWALMRLATSSTVSETVRSNAKNTLIGLRPLSSKVQWELMYIATLGFTSAEAHLLSERLIAKLHSSAEEDLLLSEILSKKQIDTTQLFSKTDRITAWDILIENKYIDLEVQKHLGSSLKMPKSF